MDINNILYRDGLSVEILQSLSYESKIGINLKKNLHYFNQQVLFKELESIESWYDSMDLLHELALRLSYKKHSVCNYEISSILSRPSELEKFLMIYLGFRSLCDEYDSIFCN